MAKKGQKFKHYPESIKTEAIRLHVDGGMELQRDHRTFGYT